MKTLSTRLFQWFAIQIIVSVMLPIPIHAQMEVPKKDVTPLSFERTELRSLYSNLGGQEYELWISLPRTYAAADSRNYPVIYVLDSYRAFAMVKGYTDMITAPFAFMPEVILVGIGYGGLDREALLRWALGRTRDLTPAKDEGTEAYFRQQIEATGVSNVEVQTGGAPQFIEFIGKELIPFVESEYRVDNDTRLLAGYSFGGLFGLYVLFHEPGLFNKYFIGSPSIHYKNQVTFEFEDQYARSHSDLKADVFMSAGSLEEETTRNVRKMEELLLSRNYKSLSLKTNYFEDEHHVSCFPAALSRSLFELLGFQNDN